MGTIFIVDAAGMGQAEYDKVMEELDLGGRTPDGCIWHHGGPTPSGWRAVDLWEGAEVFERFGQERLGPAFGRLGYPAPKIQALEVQQVRDGRLRDAAFLQVVRMPGLDRAAFEEMDRRIIGDQQVPDALVHHCNGTTAEFSWVVDTWTSQEERDRFMEAHVRPNAEQAPLTGPPIIEEMPIHNRLVRAGVTA